MNVTARAVRALASLIGVALLTVGCQTWGGRTQERGELPADLAPIFRTCAPSDGGIAIKVHERGALKGAADLDWIAKSQQVFDMQLTGPIGQTLLMVRRDSANLTLTGPLAAKVPPTKVLANGFLEVDGHFIGLRASEIPCLFRAALPSAWLQRLDSFESDDKETRIFVEEPRRDIVVSVAKTSKGYADYCVEVSWRTFLFFSRSFTWCNKDLTEARQGVLSGLGDYTLEWTRIDDQAE